MKRFVSNTFRAAVACALCCAARADEPASEAPKPIPRTRPEVKQALEALKQRQPRLPLPPPTAEELAARGDRSLVNNGRMRALYLPKHFSDHETAEVVYVVCNSAMFDRFTETLGLPLEP